MWGWMHGNGSGWGFGMVGMGLFWIVLLVVLVWVVRMVWARGSPRGGSRLDAPETPLDVLKKRYARGEINRTEYEERRKDLLS